MPRIRFGPSSFLSPLRRRRRSRRPLPYQPHLAPPTATSPRHRSGPWHLPTSKPHPKLTSPSVRRHAAGASAATAFLTSPPRHADPLPPPHLRATSHPPSHPHPHANDPASCSRRKIHRGGNKNWTFCPAPAGFPPQPRQAGPDLAALRRRGEELLPIHVEPRRISQFHIGEALSGDLERRNCAGLRKRACIAGVADDNGYGWSIAKALAAAGAEILVGTWVPALNIFETSLRRGKFDESRKLPDGSLMEITKVYPLDAVFDTLEDAPEDIKTNKRYAGSSKWAVKEVAETVKDDFGKFDESRNDPA